MEEVAADSWIREIPSSAASAGGGGKYYCGGGIERIKDIVQGNDCSYDAESIWELMTVLRKSAVAKLDQETRNKVCEVLEKCSSGIIIEALVCRSSKKLALLDAEVLIGIFRSRIFCKEDVQAFMTRFFKDKSQVVLGELEVNEICNAVVRFPTYLSNLIGNQDVSLVKQIPKCLRSKSFFRCLLSAALTLSPEQSVLYNSCILKRIIPLGYTSIAVSVWSEPNISKEMIFSIQDAILKLQSRSLESIILEMLRSKIDLKHFLLDTYKKSKQIQFLLEEKLILSRNLDDNSSNRLVLLLIEFGCDLCGILRRVSLMWAEDRFIRFANSSEQRNLSYILKHLLVSSNSRETMIEPSIMLGIQKRLELHDPIYRKEALEIASIVSKKYFPGEVNAFEAELSKETESKSDIVPRSSEFPSNESDSDSDDIDNAPRIQDIWGSWIEDVSESKKTNLINFPGNKIAKHTKPDLDIVVTKKPLKAKDPKGLKIPVFALDVVEYLKLSKQKVENWRYRDAAIERILDFENGNVFSCDFKVLNQMIEFLISLSDLEDEGKCKRDKALFLLCVNFPEIIPNFLLSHVFASSSITVADRITILTIVREVSIELSSIKKDVGGSRGPRKVSRPIESGSQRLKDEGDLLRSQVSSSSNLRLRSKNSKIKEKVKAKSFQDLCGEFFFALAAQIMSKTNLGLNENMVLNQMLFSLGTIIESAHESLASLILLRKMSRLLWEILWAFRLHTASVVRRSCTFALSRILVVLPDYVILMDYNDELDSMITWLIKNSRHDPDEIARKLSTLCLKRLQSLLNKS